MYVLSFQRFYNIRGLYGGCTLTGLKELRWMFHTELQYNLDQHGGQERVSGVNL